MNITNLFLIVLSSAFGLAYIRYGKKRSRLVPMTCGALLMAFPYFVSNLWLLLGIGILLVFIPFFIKG